MKGLCALEFDGWDPARLRVMIGRPENTNYGEGSSSSLPHHADVQNFEALQRLRVRCWFFLHRRSHVRSFRLAATFISSQVRSFPSLVRSTPRMCPFMSLQITHAPRLCCAAWLRLRRSRTACVLSTALVRMCGAACAVLTS